MLKGYDIFEKAHFFIKGRQIRIILTRSQAITSMGIDAKSKLRFDGLD